MVTTKNQFDWLKENGEKGRNGSWVIKNTDRSIRTIYVPAFWIFPSIARMKDVPYVNIFYDPFSSASRLRGNIIDNNENLKIIEAA
jgi:hypothetical protein